VLAAPTRLQLSLQLLKRQGHEQDAADRARLHSARYAMG
jgi:hypothetical protein